MYGGIACRGEPFNPSTIINHKYFTGLKKRQNPRTAECCTTAPALLTNSITITIGEFPDLTADLNAPMDDMGCGGLDEADLNMRATNVNFANIFTDRVVDVQLVDGGTGTICLRDVFTCESVRRKNNCRSQACSLSRFGSG